MVLHVSTSAKQLEVHNLTLGTREPVYPRRMKLRFPHEIRCLIRIVYLLGYSRSLVQEKQPKRAAI